MCHRPALLPSEVGLDARQHYQVLAALLTQAGLFELSSSPFRDCWIVVWIIFAFKAVGPFRTHILIWIGVNKTAHKMPVLLWHPSLYFFMVPFLLFIVCSHYCLFPNGKWISWVGGLCFPGLPGIWRPVPTQARCSANACRWSAVITVFTFRCCGKAKGTGLFRIPHWRLFSLGFRRERHLFCVMS